MVEIDCPSCGSNFNLCTAETATYARDEQRNIGHFELLEHVGTGHFGAVWKARDTELDRTVAVKIPRRSQLDDVHLEQFLREARAAAQLRHPNIVSVHEVGRHDGQVYIVSDLIDGVTIADWLTAEQPTPREAAELCAKIAAGLHHAHEAGVIHRDLKPSNVMVDTDGEPHIMDFGLAKREAGEITMTIEGKVLGTPAYMSPEQARGDAHHADRRSDVYSLGVSLFELLTGERPFRGNTRMLLHQVIHEDAPRPRRLNNAVPRDLETICLKCLEKNPDQRYSSAEDLRSELDRFLSNKPIQARPVGWVTRTCRWCVRHPAKATLVAVSALAILLSTGFGISLHYQSQLAVSLEREKKLGGQLSEAVKDRDRELYARLVGLAYHSWRDNEVARAEELLLRCPQANRSWEWDYLTKLCQSELRTIRYEELDGANQLTFSPDGTRLAILSPIGEDVRLVDVRNGRDIPLGSECEGPVAFSGDGKHIATAVWPENLTKIWNAGTGRLVHTLGGHDESVIAVAFASRQPLVATASEDGVVKIWNSDGGQSVHTLPKHAKVVDIAFAQDGERFVSMHEDGLLLVWATSDWNRVKRWQFDGSAYSIDLHPGGDFLVIDGDSATVFDLRTGEIVAEFEGSTTGFSQDGKYLPCFNGELVDLVDTESWQKVVSVDRQSEVADVQVRSDGRVLAIAGYDSAIRLYELPRLAEIRTVRGHKSFVNRIQFSPDGLRLASSSGDGTVKIWDVARPSEYRDIQAHRGQVKCIAFSSSGKSLASVDGEGHLKFWDPESGELLRTLEGRNSIVFGPGGESFAVASQGNVVNVCRVSDGSLIVALRGHTDEVHDVAYSPDGNYLASGGADHITRIWDVADGRAVTTLEAHGDSVVAVAFSRDGRFLATGDSEGKIVLWRTDDHVQLLTMDHGQGISDLIFDARNRLVSVTARVHTGSIAKIWNVGARYADVSLDGYSANATAVVLSPDGKRLITTGLNGLIAIWDLKLGGELLVIREPHVSHIPRGVNDTQTLISSDTAIDIAISGDGRFLATAHTDGTIKIRDVGTRSNDRPGAPKS